MSILSRLRSRAPLFAPVLCAVAFCCSTGPAAAQGAYPNKPIRLVVPFGAGGITDVVGRLIGQQLGDELKQPVVIDNRAGAGGSIAAQAVAQAAPDGYTLLLATVGTQVVNKMIYSKLAYDPAAFAPISLVSNSPYMMAIGDIPGVTDLQGLVAYAHAHPGQLNFGSAGNGSSPHLGIELFKLSTRSFIVHIPFKSGAEAVNAALSGQVQIVIDAIPVIQPQVKAGRLKALAIADSRRNAAVPNLRTSAEQGVPGFQIGSWNAIVAPPGTPAAQVEVLSSALSRVLARPDVVSRLAELGIEPMPTGVAAYERHVRAETEKWSKVTRAAGTKLD